MKKSKFYTPTPFKERVIDFFKGLPFWRGGREEVVGSLKPISYL